VIDIFLHNNLINSLKTVAQQLNVPFKSNLLRIPLGLGNGWLLCYELEHFNILLADATFNKNVNLIFPDQKSNHSFILQITEAFTQQQSIATNAVELLHSDKNYQLQIPANSRLKLLRVSFNHHTLASISSPENVEEMEHFFLNSVIQQKPVFLDVEFRTILDEVWVDDVNHPFKNIFIQNKIYRLIELFIIKKYAEQTNSATAKIRNNDLDRLVHAEALLVKDYTSPPPTIEKLSKICAMSATKLKTTFKSLYGVPIYEYYQKNRMAKAKTLLIEGNYTCKEVGTMVGYSNLSHFAAAFKKEFGINPSELLPKQTA
jgi:AraC-like DNA-binding protein